ncbi:CrpP family ICE-associated protein [Pseudomonas agarici]|uniref:CrpP family ICE-associated protein n=1 Tax=Pseudomonas agarici TaxID=46677 RepID=UPI001ABF26EB|nr:CrpP family ICE-associated protein [Pseudomonas agarici]
MDRRQFNNPHAVVHTAGAGAGAARKGLRVCSCPYHHPAMRASWLKGFAQAQQLTLDL